LSAYRLHAWFVLNYGGVAAPSRRGHPYQRHKQPYGTDRHQDVPHDGPVDVSGVKRDREAEDCARRKQDDGSSESHEFLLDAATSHVAPDEQRNGDDQKDYENFDEHKLPFRL
jgi:hypothetical protein